MHKVFRKAFGTNKTKSNTLFLHPKRPIISEFLLQSISNVSGALKNMAGLDKVSFNLKYFSAICYVLCMAH